MSKAKKTRVILKEYKFPRKIYIKDNRFEDMGMTKINLTTLGGEIVVSRKWWGSFLTSNELRAIADYLDKANKESIK